MTEKQAERIIQQNNIIILLMHQQVMATCGHGSAAILMANKAVEENTKAMEANHENQSCIVMRNGI